MALPHRTPAPCCGIRGSDGSLAQDATSTDAPPPPRWECVPRHGAWWAAPLDDGVGTGLNSSTGPTTLTCLPSPPPTSCWLPPAGTTDRPRRMPERSPDLPGYRQSLQWSTGPGIARQCQLPGWLHRRRQARLQLELHLRLPVRRPSECPDSLSGVGCRLRAADAGAVTWISRDTGKLATGADSFGPLSSLTSLVGSLRGRSVGQDNVTLTNFFTGSGGPVTAALLSPEWKAGPTAPSAGAVTWLDVRNGNFADGSAAVGAVSGAQFPGGSARQVIPSGASRLPRA